MAQKPICAAEKSGLEEYGLVITKGATDDNKYSLTIQNFGGRPCLCVHKCDYVDGWHYSSMDRKSFVTAIGFDKLKSIVNDMESRPYLFETEESDDETKLRGVRVKDVRKKNADRKTHTKKKLEKGSRDRKTRKRT